MKPGSNPGPPPGYQAPAVKASRRRNESQERSGRGKKVAGKRSNKKLHKKKKEQTFRGGVGVGEGLVGSLSHEGPLVLLVVPAALDDLLVQLPQRFCHLDLTERRVQAADIEKPDLLGKHPKKQCLIKTDSREKP